MPAKKTFPFYTFLHLNFIFVYLEHNKFSSNKKAGHILHKNKKMEQENQINQNKNSIDPYKIKK